MSRKNKRKENLQYVTRAECLQISTAIKEGVTELKGELKTIRTALVGEDYRGGIVKDVADLKQQSSTVALIVKSVVVPIVVAVITALTLSST